VTSVLILSCLYIGYVCQNVIGKGNNSVGSVDLSHTWAVGPFDNDFTIWYPVKESTCFGVKKEAWQLVNE
jgi:hypothetical protein